MGNCQKKTFYAVYPQLETHKKPKPTRYQYLNSAIEEFSLNSEEALMIPPAFILGNKAIMAVAAYLATDKNIFTLSITENKVSDEGAKRISQAIIRSSVTSIDLSGNEIGARGAKHLARMISKCEVIREIKLEGNNFGKNGTMRLLKSIKAKRTLTALSLSHLDRSCMELLANQHHGCLTMLCISDTKFYSAEMEHLNKYLRKSKGLTTLIMKKCKFTAKTIIILTKTIKKKEHLKDVRFEEIQPLDEKVDLGKLVDLVHNDFALEKFAFVSYPLKEIDITSLSNKMLSNHSLKSICLSGCGLNPQGLDNLTTAIKSSSRFKPEFIDISGNALPPHSLSSLLSVVKSMDNLKGLNIEGNLFDMNCCRRLGEFLRLNSPCLHQVNITNCLPAERNIREEMVEILGLALMRNTRLTSFITSFAVSEKMKLLRCMLQNGLLHRVEVILTKELTSRNGIKAVLDFWKSNILNGNPLTDVPAYIFTLRDYTLAFEWAQTFSLYKRH